MFLVYIGGDFFLIIHVESWCLLFLLLLDLFEHRFFCEGHVVGTERIIGSSEGYT